MSGISFGDGSSINVGVGDDSSRRRMRRSKQFGTSFTCIHFLLKSNQVGGPIT